MSSPPPWHLVHAAGHRLSVAFKQMPLMELDESGKCRGCANESSVAPLEGVAQRESVRQSLTAGLLDGGTTSAFGAGGRSQMARFLVLYGTSDGHTAKVARAIGDTLRALGGEVHVVEAGDPGGSPWPEEYSGVVVAASVHAGGYQRSVRAWVRAHRRGLEERPTAFVSVCLGVLQRDPAVQRDLRVIIDRFVKTTGWVPTMTQVVAGALLYTRYNWLKRLAMKRIVRKAGGDTDTSRDYEYTDWSDLRAFAERFGKCVSGDSQLKNADRYAPCETRVA